MSAITLLNSILKTQQEAYPTLTEDSFFEIYCADNILLNYDLTNAEIESGIVDGPKDGGIDSVYVFVNKRLLTEDFEFSHIKQPVEIDLHVIQSKNQSSFKEGPVDKLTSSLPMLLDEDMSSDKAIELFSPSVVQVFQSFIKSMRSLATKFPKVSIQIYYCSKGAEVNKTVREKGSSLEKKLSNSYNSVSFKFLGAKELYDRSSKQKRLVKELRVVGSPLSGENSYAGMCTLGNYIKFISDEDGLLTRMFEANVRDYQGEVEVNKEIAASLKTPVDGLDFWWLNNGVTIVADQAQFMNNRLTIENPLIVNGLQTSHEIYKYRESINDRDERQVLVRVLVETDRGKRDRIIRATNRQTNIKHSSFRATEPIHKQIEDYLLTLGYYYDRRKNFYKREGKPANKIISIDRLAQAVLSTLIVAPHTARARPTTALKAEKDYKNIFSEDHLSHPLEMYGNLVRILFHIENYFKSISTSENQQHRNNLKFHVLMVIVWSLCGGTNTPAKAIKSIDMELLNNQFIEKVVSWVFSEFDINGAEDRTAKEQKFTEQLKTNWTDEIIG